MRGGKGREGWVPEPRRTRWTVEGAALPIFSVVTDLRALNLSP